MAKEIERTIARETHENHLYKTDPTVEVAIVVMKSIIVEVLVEVEVEEREVEGIMTISLEREVERGRDMMIV